MRAPAGMPGIAFTYEMDGREHIAINGTSYPIPGYQCGSTGAIAWDVWSVVVCVIRA